MTGNDLPANPSVLNTTVLSNFAYIDQLWIVADLSGICTVPVVREELEHGVANHPYLQEALDMLDSVAPSKITSLSTDSLELHSQTANN